MSYPEGYIKPIELSSDELEQTYWAWKVISESVLASIRQAEKELETARTALFECYEEMLKRGLV